MIGRDYANNFDIIRLFAALQVFYNHITVHLAVPQLPYPYYLFVTALPGVPIFFVISGFLVTQSFLSGGESVAGYFIRRALRIYPGLWAHYLVVFAAFVATGALTWATIAQPTFAHWILGAFFIGSDFWGNIAASSNVFDYSGFYKSFPSGVLWTISVELGFYALAPLVLFPRSRSMKLLLMAAAAVVSLYFAVLLRAQYNSAPGANTTGMLMLSPFPHFWVFLLGAGAAVMWRTIKPLFTGKALWWLAAYATATYFDPSGIDPILIEVGAALRMVVLAGFILSCAFTAPSASRVLRGADFSYGFYLYHMPVIWTFALAGEKGHAWLWPAVLLITLSFAAASWFGIERPAQRLKARYSQRTE